MNIAKPCRTKLRHSKVRLCSLKSEAMFLRGEVKEKNAFIEQLNNNNDNNNNNNNNNNKYY